MNKNTNGIFCARIALIGFAVALCLAFVIVFSRMLTVQWGCMVLNVLGDVSAILFGIFGIWLGMFYSPAIQDSLNGKEGEALAVAAENVVASSKRFKIVFRGMVISAVVLVFAMLVRTLQAPLVQMACTCHPMIKICLRHAFFTLVSCALFAQCYSVIMAIVPMYDAKKKMGEAQKFAELVINT